jgi:hypothetical protein
VNSEKVEVEREWSCRYYLHRRMRLLSELLYPELRNLAMASLGCISCIASHGFGTDPLSPVMLRHSGSSGLVETRYALRFSLLLLRTELAMLGMASIEYQTINPQSYHIVPYDLHKAKDSIAGIGMPRCCRCVDQFHLAMDTLDCLRHRVPRCN